jgi:N-acetylglucosamine-6-phosphate deacetylase
MIRDLPCIAPAFWDLQTNGRWGVSFSDDSITVEQVGEIVRAHAALGTARLCPTLITASFEATLHGVATIAQACDRWPEIEAMVLGIHLEGPWVSERDGYRGAHPFEHARDPDLGEFERWQAACGRRIRIVTLAPERLAANAAIRFLNSQGVVVALGHTAADRATIEAACQAGARLSTHLGNGVESHPPRHPNPIWDQAAQLGLSASLIADGHHLGPSIVQVLVRTKGLDRIVLVSDFSPLAGLPVGTYGPWSVDAGGKIVVTGTPYLAGANRGLDHGLANLAAWTGVTLLDAWSTVTTNPARLLGADAPAIKAGEPANFVVFHEMDNRAGQSDRPRIEIVRTCVDGRWCEPEASGE